MLPSPQECNGFLEIEAKRLSSLYSGEPKPVGRICHDLGVSIERGAQQSFKTYMIFPKSSDEWARILLPSAPGKQQLNFYQRFCIAHELAHYLLYLKYGSSPEGRSQYWQHEHICDKFARNLLLPRPVIGRFDPRRVLVALETSSLKHRVPLMQVAKADSDNHPSRLSFRIALQGENMRIVSGSGHNSIGVGSLVKGILAHRLRRIVDSEVTEVSSVLCGNQITFLKQASQHADYRVSATRLLETASKGLYLSLQRVDHT